MRQVPMTIAEALLEMSSNKPDLLSLVEAEAIAAYPNHANNLYSFHFKDESFMYISSDQAWIIEPSVRRLVFVKS